jgi:hypothetical protein
MTSNLARLLALALALLPARAFAAPATVRAFEAPAHSAPDPSSPIVYTFTESARLSVSDDVTNGFRRVRLPNGAVGWVADSLVALEARAAPPPPSAAPPPPPYAGAPPPPPYGGAPPPPPGAYPSPYRPRRAYADPTAFRHVGLFLRLNLGLGYMASSSPADQTSALAFDTSKGGAGDFSFAIGGTPSENFVVAGEFWSSWAASPALSFQGASIPNGGTFSNSLHGIGPQLTWYFMPSNTFLSVTPSLTWMNFGDGINGFDSDVGFGTRLALGKEWWVGAHWGLGLAGWFAFSVNDEGSGADARWRTYEGGLAFSVTLN